MLIKKSNNWDIKESSLTSESTYFSRRKILKGMGFAGAALLAGRFNISNAATTSSKYTKESLGVPLTTEETAAEFNNFYEFGSHKAISRRAQSLDLDSWTINIDGEVEKDISVDVNDLIASMPIEERFYRFRCVEAWAMAVPWTGFTMKALLDFAKPTSDAKFIIFQTALQDKNMPGLSQSWYPWPYTEGVTMAEAQNDLAFLATGIYGHSLPKQHGAPLRMVLPWKYGFKSGKSINRIMFLKERPKTFWEEINAKEYGFWANVNPEVPHPRWSQARERDIDSGDFRPTKIFNGYAEEVGNLYSDLPDDVSFR